MSNPFTAFLDDEEQGFLFQNCMRQLAMLDLSKMKDGIQRINIETSIGPMLDPTAYLGNRFDNANNYTELFRLTIPLVEKLQEIRSGS